MSWLLNGLVSWIRVLYWWLGLQRLLILLGHGLLRQGLRLSLNLGLGGHHWLLLLNLVILLGRLLLVTRLTHSSVISPGLGPGISISGCIRPGLAPVIGVVWLARAHVSVIGPACIAIPVAIVSLIIVVSLVIRAISVRKLTWLVSSRSHYHDIRGWADSFASCWVKSLAGCTLLAKGERSWVEWARGPEVASAHAQTAMEPRSGIKNFSGDLLISPIQDTFLGLTWVIGCLGLSYLSLLWLLRLRLVILRGLLDILHLLSWLLSLLGVVGDLWLHLWRLLGVVEGLSSNSCILSIPSLISSSLTAIADI